MKRKEVKSKGEKERYIHFNVEFQRIARRDKKTFLSDQCKEIVENNRMGKTRDLFKEIRDTKGTFHGTTLRCIFRSVPKAHSYGKWLKRKKKRRNAVGTSVVVWG